MRVCVFVFACVHACVCFCMRAYADDQDVDVLYMISESKRRKVSGILSRLSTPVTQRKYMHTPNTRCWNQVRI